MLTVEVWVLSLLAVGILLLAALAASRSFRRRLLAGEGVSTWVTGSDVGLALGLFLIELGVLGALAYAARQQAVGTGWRLTGLRKLVLGISPTVLAAVAICVLARLRGRTPEQALGLASSRSTRDAGYGLVAYLAAYPAVLAVLALWGRLFYEFDVTVQPQEVTRTLLVPQAWPEVAASVGIVVLVAPLLEEMVFRGFLLPAVSRRTGPAVAILLTAALFGLVHRPFFYAGPTFALGVLLGWLYWRTGRLWVSVGCHGAHNAVMVITSWLSPP